MRFYSLTVNALLLILQFFIIIIIIDRESVVFKNLLIYQSNECDDLILIFHYRIPSII